MYHTMQVIKYCRTKYIFHKEIVTKIPRTLTIYFLTEQKEIVTKIPRTDNLFSFNKYFIRIVKQCKFITYSQYQKYISKIFSLWTNPL